MRRYLGASLVLHVGWEIGQLPLYTLWSTEPWAKQAFAVIHCTIGDVMIAVLSLVIALAVVGRAGWPRISTRSVWLLSLLLGVGYTVYSEWLNVNVRGSWSYSSLMPTLPLIGTGLSPVLQWLVVPTIVQWFVAGRPPWAEPDPAKTG